MAVGGAMGRKRKDPYQKLYARSYRHFQTAMGYVEHCVDELLKVHIESLNHPDDTPKRDVKGLLKILQDSKPYYDQYE
jgi:hypothetical protein